MPRVRPRPPSLLRPCCGLPLRRRPQSQTTRWPTSSTKPPPSSKRESAGLLQPRPGSDGLPQAKLTVPPTYGFPTEKDLIPAAWNFAVTSCLRPAARNPSPGSTKTQNLTENETPRGRSTTRPKDAITTACVSPQRFSTATPERGRTPNVPWSPGSPGVSAPPLNQRHQSRVGSAPLGLPLCDGFAWFPREALLLHQEQMTGGPRTFTRSSLTVLVFVTCLFVAVLNCCLNLLKSS